MSNGVNVLKAKKIITLDDANPVATHVVVEGDRVKAVGGAGLEHAYGVADARFSDCVLTPGFVEGHAHAMEGTIWKLPYVGFYDRLHPDGGRVNGCDSVTALIDRLRSLEADLGSPDETLFAWGYDSIYFDDKPLRQDLDNVSRTRPVVIFHSNLHLITVNTVALERAGISRDNAIDGVFVDDHGDPNGELAEFAAMFPVFRATGNPVFGGMNDAEGLRRYGRSCHRAGITTAADLYNELDDGVVDTLGAVTAEPDFPARIVPALGAMSLSIDTVLERARKVRGQGHEKLYLGAVKLITDGSIQGYSARVRQPYINGIENGVWVAPPARIQEMIRVFHAADIKLHIHVNGDQAAELVLQEFQKEIAAQGRRRRHVLQHAQMMDREQLQRAADLGLMVNLFANHTWYWGDQHRDATVGPEIAPRMNAARTALDVGLEIAVHCDAPVSPMGPLFTAWCAVNRKTASGREHGPEERITPAEALRAITLGPAISLDLDDRLGSIVPGKFADFTVLDDDPLSVEPMKIEDIQIRGTVLGGRWQPAV